MALGAIHVGESCTIDHNVHTLNSAIRANHVGDIQLFTGKCRCVMSAANRLYSEKTPDLATSADDHELLRHGNESGTPGLGYR